MSDMMPFRKNNLSRREDSFSDFIRDLFDDDFFTSINYNRGNFRADLKEANGNYYVEADLPGVKKGDIEIDYHNNYLIISAKRDESMENDKENYVRRERHYGEFKRSFHIDNVDEDNIKASFNDGVLKIILPKLNKEDNNRRRINIE